MKRRDFLQLTAGVCFLTWSDRYLLAAAGGRVKHTGFNFEPVYLEHTLGADHPESPQRLETVMQVLKDQDWYAGLSRVHPDIDAFPWIYEIHTADHVSSIKTHYPRSHEVALTVVRAVLTAVEQVCTGRLRNAFCATRPPGHHALNTGREEGFCFYNSIAIAARYAQKHHQLQKILIVDWDYHHGNATEAAFYSDPGVLFFSTHDFYAYPGTGDPARKGEGAGLGYNINVHLKCGTTDTDILAAFENYLLPAARDFRPDLILISAGFDSRQDDLLGCFNITDQGFVKLTQMVMALADEFCEGRIVSVLEGGYNLQGNASAVMHHVKTLAGK